MIAQRKLPPGTPSTVVGGRTWEDEFEREQGRAGMRFFGGGGAGPREVERWREGGSGWDGRRVGGRSWEV